MNIIQKHFGLAREDISEEDLRQWLSERIEWMLGHEMDLLWSTLYRLDIDEEKILGVIERQAETPIPAGLADLVLARQKMRNSVRNLYSSAEKSNEFGWDV